MANRGNTLWVALAVTVLVAATQTARASDDGMVLRAVGFFQAEASGDGGACSIPTISEGIQVSSDTIGLWDTFGQPTIQYPIDICLGWMQLQNTMTAQGINIEKVDIRLRIAGAGRFRQFVPTRNGFPTACRALRHSTVFAGAHLFPFGTDPNYGNTASGVGHVAFVNLFPMVNSQVIHCLREQYAGLPADVFVTFPLIIRAVATGRTETNETVKSNPIQFTLNLLHLCGNGRVEPGEECDPAAPNACNNGPCTVGGACQRNPALGCVTDADCAGTCLPAGDPLECSCQ
jgi:hypothetical protein